MELSGGEMYKGNKWYKCDLHLHTKDSNCFLDKTITPNEWIDEVVKKGVECIAVTDHNSGEGIDKIIELGKEVGVTVFPGVELTCDTTQIHLLVLFDINKTSRNVNAFLSKCGIDEDRLGEKDNNSSKSIFEILEIAKKNNALVIPAHIDGHNGLEKVSDQNLNDLMKSEEILGVQIVHKEFIRDSIDFKKEKESLINGFSKKYGTINLDGIKRKYLTVKKALESKKAILTFSDNPSNIDSAKHGIEGIGEYYTWIKMSEKPNLNDLRQALLMHDTRIKNFHLIKEEPYSVPDSWIKSIEIKNNELAEDLKVEFNPQLNSIIGGRGSGKSSILRFIRGVLGSDEELQGMDEILKDQEDFYQEFNIKQKKGVLNRDSKIKIEYVRNNSVYLIEANNIKSWKSQKIEVKKYDKKLKSWKKIEKFDGAFKIEQYSQKQIYEIADKPMALKKQLEKFSEKFNGLFRERKEVEREILLKCSQKKSLEEKLELLRQTKFELQECKDQIKGYEDIKISEKLESRRKFVYEWNLVEKISLELGKRIDILNGLKSQIELDKDFKLYLNDFNVDEFGILKEEITNVISGFEEEIEKAKDALNKSSEKIKNFQNTSNWKVDFDENLNNLNQFSEAQGMQEKNIVSEFEGLLLKEKTLSSKLDSLKEEEGELDKLEKELLELKKNYLAKSALIFSERSKVARKINEDGSIKIQVKKFRDIDEFTEKFREIINKETGYDSDISNLVEQVFKGDVEKTIKVFIDNINNLHLGKPVEGVGGHFLNAMKKLSSEQLDKIGIIIPDDKIEISYRSREGKKLKPLSTASAGQKTAAILNILLSKGETPIILDQPEDDLDNKLVYELVVERLIKIKDKRQIICVTHNANIPVNGDSEYVLSMNSESSKLEILTKGSVDDLDIRREICDVMEGSKTAFDMRSKRYKQIGK